MLPSDTPSGTGLSLSHLEKSLKELTLNYYYNLKL